MVIHIFSNKKFKKSLLIVAMISVFLITIFSLIKLGNEGYSELSILMYSSDNKTYIAANYPKVLNSDKNVSIFFIVKNFHEIPIYYQVQIKITTINQTISIKEPLSSKKSHLLYPNNTYEKILPPATKQEKLNSTDLFAPYVWSPTNVTLFFEPRFSDILNGSNMLKIVIELWEFDVDKGTFVYSGVFVYLKLFHFY